MTIETSFAVGIFGIVLAEMLILWSIVIYQDRIARKFREIRERKVKQDGYLSLMHQDDADYTVTSSAMTGIEEWLSLSTSASTMMMKTVDEGRDEAAQCEYCGRRKMSDESCLGCGYA